MKWKRAEPGKYTSGDWTVAGKGTKWRLLCGDEEVGTGSSKKELQQVAEDADKDEATKPRKTPPRRVPGKKVKDPTVEDLPRVVEKGEAPVSLDNALRSIRLTLDSLAYSNNALAATMRQLADSNESMSKAVRELIAYLKQVEKKK